jgi:hypothetical protein
MPRNRNASQPVKPMPAVEPPCPMCNGRDVIESDNFDIAAPVFQCMDCGYWGTDRNKLDNPPEDHEASHWVSGQAMRRPMLDQPLWPDED